MQLLTLLCKSYHSRPGARVVSPAPMRSGALLYKRPHIAYFQDQSKCCTPDAAEALTFLRCQLGLGTFHNMRRSHHRGHTFVNQFVDIEATVVTHPQYVMAINRLRIALQHTRGNVPYSKGSMSVPCLQHKFTPQVVIHDHGMHGCTYGL